MNLDWAKTSEGRVDPQNKFNEFRFKAYKTSAVNKEKIEEVELF